MRLVAGGKVLEPQSMKSCILYDPSDGRIVHHHEVVSFPGANEVEEKEVETTTRRIAG